MQRYKYASLVDLKAGYHNIPWDDTNKYGTFVTHRGKFRWRRMPFGLSNAPAHFQWVMEDIIHGEDASGQPQAKLNCQIYLDDFTICADTMDECL